MIKNEKNHSSYWLYGKWKFCYYRFSCRVWDCQNEYKSYEYVLLHCPNGLFDLEDKLLIGNNAIRSDMEAIRSFELQMKKLYDKKYWWVGNYKKLLVLIL